MYKKLTCLLLVAICLVFAGCKKDSEVNAFITDYDAFSNEIVKHVDDSPNVAGVDAAQKYLDSKKADIRAKFEAFKDARGFQLSEDTTKKLTESVTRNVSAVNGLEVKYMSQSIQNSEFKSKLEKLVKDYNEIIKM